MVGSQQVSFLVKCLLAAASFLAPAGCLLPPFCWLWLLPDLRHIPVLHLAQPRGLRLVWQLVQLEGAGHGHARRQAAAAGQGMAGKEGREGAS